MGKEIIRPRDQGLSRKFSVGEKAVRAGLASLAIAVPLFLEGCSKNPSSSQPQTGISRDNPQFPNTGNDRPLQNQPAKKEAPTLTSIPTPKPTETPKPVVENKISLSKKPEELFRALLTTLMQENELPSGMIARGNSAGNLDATAKALDAVGQVNIAIAGTDSSLGISTSAISYTIFSKASYAKNAYDIVTQSLSNSRVLESVYPATISTQSLMGVLYMSIVVSQVDNVMLVVTLTEKADQVSQANAELNTVNLVDTARRQLAKVGR